MSSPRTRLRLLLVFLGVMLSSPVLGADWPHWRGPRRDGTTSEKSGWQGGKWLSREPAWRTNVGEGGTSPLVVGGKLYTLGWKNGKDTLVCLDALTGKEQWRVSYEAPQYGRHHMGDENWYSGTSSTPEYDPETGFLYTLSIDGDLNCWDTKKQGERIWGMNLYDRFRVPQRPRSTRQGHRDYGYTSSPLIHGDWLLVEVGSSEGNLMAFERRTGKRLWASENTDPAGHNSGPTPMTVEKVPCVAVLTLRGLVVTRLDKGHEGKTVATRAWATDYANNIVGPAVHHDCVYLTSGYNHQAICKLHVSLKGATKVWESPHFSQVCTPVVHRGHLYWVWEKVRCLDEATGKLLWEGGRFKDPGSCVVTADDRLIVCGDQGRIALVESPERSPKKYTELAVRDNVFPSLAWPHLAVAEGRLYAKDREGNLVCFPLKP